MLRLAAPVLILLALLAFVLFQDKPAPRADFTFINRGDVSTLDLQRMSWLQDLRVGRMLFEGLVRKDVFSSDFRTVPAAADSWTVSPDGTTYVFHIRPDARWSNGEPLRAADFVYSWRRAMLPETRSDYASQFLLIRGGDAFFAWRERAIRGMTLRAAASRRAPGRLFSPGTPAEEAASTVADAVWFIIENRPHGVAPPPLDSFPPSTAPLVEARRTLDDAAVQLASLRRQAAAASPAERPPLELSIAAQKERLDAALARADPLIPEVRRLLDAGTLTGAQIWSETEAAFDAIVDLHATGEKELTFTLQRRTPYFLELLSLAVFYPVYPPLVRQYERPDPATGSLDIQTGWSKPPLIISNGAFKLTQWRFKRDMRFEKNPFYWNAAAVNLDTVSIPCVEDPNAQILAFDSGVVDWISDVTPAYRADMLASKRAFYAEHKAEYDRMVAEGVDPVEIDRRLPADPRNRIHAFQAFGTYFYNFNCLPKLSDGRDNPFARPIVRRAFAMAVDRARIADEVRRVGERPSSVLVPLGSIPGYPSPQGLPYDPIAARALLAEAGYPNGAGFPTVDILFNKDSGHDVIAQAVARDWQQNLGVSVSLSQKEIEILRNDLKDHNFMVSRAGWYGDYGDPTTFLDINRTGDGNNDRAYSNPRFDALLDRAAEEPDESKRLGLLAEAERILVEEDVPLIPIFQYVQVCMFDPHKLSGVTSHPRQEQNVDVFDILRDSKGADLPRSIPPSPPSPPSTPSASSPSSPTLPSIKPAPADGGAQ